MEAKLQRWVQRHGWDRAVEHYECYWRDQLRPAHDAVLELARLEPGDRVVDIAGGIGMVTLPAADVVGQTGRVLATDLAERMVNDTAKRAADHGVANVDVLRCGAEDLGAIGEFDVALCSLGLMYVPSPATAMNEIARVLRTGGRAVAAVWGERRNCGWAELFPIVDVRVRSDVCPMFFALGAPGSLTALFERGGFTDIEERRIDVELVYGDAEAALGAAFLGGPVALAYSRFDDDTKASAHVDYLNSIAAYRHGNGYRVPGEFVIVSGRRAETARQATTND